MDLGVHKARTSARPFVFEVRVAADDVAAFYDGRGEKEAILVPYDLDPQYVVIEGTSTAVDELREDSTAPAG
jgi:hypothetical protein